MRSPITAVFLALFLPIECFSQEICDGNDCEIAALLQRSQMRVHQKAGPITGANSILTNLHDSTQRRASILQFSRQMEELVESAEVTPAVVELVGDIANMLSSAVIPVISQEHDTDQGSLNSAYGRFDTLDGVYEQSYTSNQNTVDEIQMARLQHLRCRDGEADLCVAQAECERELSRFKRIFDSKNNTFREADIEVDALWCLTEEDRAEQHFRDHSRNLFTRFNTARVERHIAEDNYLAQLSVCQGVQVAHEGNTTACDALQGAFEQASCGRVSASSFEAPTYYAEYVTAVDYYREEEEGVRVTEADRKVEYVTLQQAICLLQALMDPEHGAASSDETASVITGCHLMSPDTTHLDINYHSLPPPRLFSPPSSEEVCSSSFIASEYEGLPECTVHTECSGCGISIEVETAVAATLPEQSDNICKSCEFCEANPDQNVYPILDEHCAACGYNQQTWWPCDTENLCRCSSHQAPLVTASPLQRQQNRPLVADISEAPVVGAAHAGTAAATLSGVAEPVMQK